MQECNCRFPTMLSILATTFSTSLSSDSIFLEMPASTGGLFLAPPLLPFPLPSEATAAAAGVPAPEVAALPEAVFGLHTECSANWELYIACLKAFAADLEAELSAATAGAPAPNKTLFRGYHLHTACRLPCLPPSQV